MDALSEISRCFLLVGKRKFSFFGLNDFAFIHYYNNSMRTKKILVQLEGALSTKWCRRRSTLFCACRIERKHSPLLNL